MKRNLILLCLTILIGATAHYRWCAESESHDAEAQQQIQTDIEHLNERLGLLLGQIRQNEVTLNSLSGLWQTEGIGFVLYQDGNVTEWTTNAIPFANRFGARNGPRQGMVQLRNMWFVCRTIEVDGQLLAAFGLVRTELPFKNRYLGNHWGPRISGTDNTSVTFSSTGTFPILINGKPTGTFLRFTDGHAPIHFSLSAMLWWAFLALSVYVLWLTANGVAERHGQALSNVAFASMLIVIRVLLQWLQWPESFYSLELFSPELHATSAMLPSLGDFLLHATVAVLIFWRVSRVEPTVTANPAWRWVAVLMPMLSVWPAYLLFETLVVNSSVSFDLNVPFSLNGYSFVGLFVSFLILSCQFLVLRIFGKLIGNNDRKPLLLVLPWLVAMTFLYVLLGADTDAVIVSLTTGFVYGFLLLMQGRLASLKGISYYTPTVLSYTILACAMLILVEHENEEEDRRSLARSIEEQQDPITEYLFEKAEQEILNDRVLRNLLSALPMDEDKVIEALRQPFVYDHWNRYLTHVDVFNNEGGLMASDRDIGPNYFELQREFGLSRPTISDHFRYIGTSQNEGSYLARIDFDGRRSQRDLVVFITFIPEKTDDILGFTDLFIDEGISTAKELAGYSYALYANGELQEQHGDHPYSLSASEYDDYRSESSCYSSDGYHHLVYRPVNERLVVVSRKEEGLIGYLTIFSYLFMFYFVLTTLIALADGKRLREMLAQRSFRNRINLAMSSVLLVSLLLIGVLTVFYVVREYNDRNREMISEKSRSVLMELEGKMRDHRSFTPEDELHLSMLLNKFSKVFFTDINLYGLDGRLLATSRPRLFEEGLMAEVMDPDAYREMRFSRKSSYIQQETIGQLTYLTAYVPFRNENQDVIAYMSLPYFARQYGLQQQIFSLLAALTNIYVFLILLSVVMALIISNHITEPLRFIRESLKNLKLDQRNRAIEWNSNDEIGQLVMEYNRTLNELVESAELLARSERESAWREMAKQVAHEIKNPLTPMKLSIQMLQRSMNDGATDLNERIEKVSRTLIEQIDTLTNIANEFASFAKMPKPILEDVNLQRILENAAELHRNPGITIRTNLVVDGICIVHADKEQLLRVFNNLIKNGIQAIPEDREGEIVLGLIRDGNRWVTSVRDNGSGIPEDLQDKIFVPNFTTKTSGMGLGLAMVRNIVETVNGRIWFQTDEGLGTTFYISLPVV